MVMVMVMVKVKVKVRGSSSTSTPAANCLALPSGPFLTSPSSSLPPSSSQCLPSCRSPLSSSLLHPLAFSSSTPFLPSTMPNLSKGTTNRILRSLSRQANLGQPPEPQVIVTQKDQFSSEQQIFDDAKRNIDRAAAPTELIYLGIPPTWGALIADSLTEYFETTGGAGGR